MPLVSTEKLSILSSVGGGPMARLVDKLAETGTEATVRHQFEPAQWRHLMSSGHTGRALARFSSLGFFPLKSAVESCFSHEHTLIPTTNPFLLPPALVASRSAHGKRVVPLIYDLYPEALEASGSLDPNSRLSRTLGRLNKFTFEHADGVVFIGRRMAEHAIARYGSPRHWTVIQTGADPLEFEEHASAAERPEDELEKWCASKKLVVTYVGNMGNLHDWDTLTRAIEKWGQKPHATDVGFVIAASGPGAAHLRDELGDGFRNILRFSPPLSDRQWARLLVISDVSAVTLAERARHTCVPSKAFSAIAAKNALLAICPSNSDLGDLVADGACGRQVVVGDADRVVRILEHWLEHPKALSSAQEEAFQTAQRFDTERLAKQWVTFLSGLDESNPRVSP